MSNYRFSAVLLSLLFTAAMVAAQTTASMKGKVVDEQGQALPGVTVSVSSESLITGRMTTVSGTGGNWRFPSLPPGSYEVQAVMEGFRTAVHRGVPLRLGQNLDVTLTLLPVISERVVVSGLLPLKTSGNEVSQNFSVEELNRMPVSHDVNELINYAPGINEDRAYGATGEGANAFNLDGVDVSDPGNGEHWMLPHMDWVQEIQIMGLGANAEYGGYTGAMYNIVTRSGGNELKGSLSLYFSSDDLVSENTPSGNEDLTPASLDSDVDLAVSIGGPLVKNKAWYFVSAQRAEIEEVPLGAERAEETTLSRYLAKFTMQPNDSHRLTALLDYDGKKEDFRGVGRNTLASASTNQDSPNVSYNLTWDWMGASQGLLTTKISGFSGSDDRLPLAGSNTPGHTDFESGLAWGNAAYTRLRDKRRLGISADYTLFKDGLFGRDDAHGFKFGVSFNRARHVETRSRNGGFTFVDDTYPLDVLSNPDDLAAYLSDPLAYAWSSDRGNEIHLDSVQKTFVAYIQDSVELGDVIIEGGLRYSRFDAGFDGGNESVYEDDVIAPRLGFSWNLDPEGKTTVKAHFGRYYESMFAYLYDREQSGNAFQDTEYFDFNGDLENPAWDVPAGGRSATLASLDPNIEHPYVDQFLITLEQGLGANSLIGIDLIRRESRQIIAMVNNTDDYDSLLATANPLGADIPFFDLLSQADYTLTNPEDAYRDYSAVMLRYERRYADGWSLRGSLVWSDLEGNAYAGDSYVNEWEDLNGRTNSDGKLPGYSEWEFKLNASVALPFRIDLGAYYRFLSGEYWTPEAQIRGLYFNDRQSVFITDRGSRQLADRSLLDLKLSRRFVPATGMSLDCYLDIFNVTNENTVLELDERWGTYYYDFRNHPTGSEWEERGAFGQALRIEKPREIRIGSRLKF